MRANENIPRLLLWLPAHDMVHTLIDLTQLLDTNIPVFPGDPPFSSRPFSSVSRDGYSVHALSCSSHAGTHIDAPAHFLVDGATVDQLPLSTFILPALVLDVSHKKARECIAWDSVVPVADRIRPGTAVLFRTGWSRYWGCSNTATATTRPSSTPGSRQPTAHHYFDHPWLAVDVAEQLLALGVRVVGTDTMNPDQSPSHVSAVVGGDGGGDSGTEGEGEPLSDFGFHMAILGAGGIIVENLTNLDLLQAAQDAAEPDTEVIVSLLPLKIAGCDGTPIRAVAWLQHRGSMS
ncbi:putative cyclase [Russula earlei]|uniref:Cyclase n=1 Tax=Russula earlei TaxID=71964 RepID=A0ACC0UIR2_9AGAM|nr:putative cyclase [Russula earlei]